MSEPADTHKALERLAGSIDEALDLLQRSALAPGAALTRAETPASLLEQCLALCAQLEEARPEPLRTVHHLACTGGTLICKCLAAMPNVQLMGEADPLSPLARKSDELRFAPGDVASLAAQSTRGARPELLTEIFLGGLAVAYADCTQLGQRLVLRDHAHSHFCVGPEVPQRPTLRALVRQRFPLLSLVTVRHPLDSYLSLADTKWLHFEPRTFEEYCRRWQAFLDAYAGLPIVRYEDFVRAPAETMVRICKVLELPFSEQFGELFGVFRLTGDSGRSGGTIEPRPRRKIGAELAEEIERAAGYRPLLARLGYPEDENQMEAS